MLNLLDEVKIRPFSQDDLNAVLEIQDACRPIAAWRSHDYEQLACDPKGMILVAEIEGAIPKKLLGFAAFFRLDEEAELWNIGVAPRYQRQGVAKSLLREACRRLFEDGARRLFLEVRSSNTAAIELYHSLGFTLVTSRRDYYENPREDGLILVLGLVRLET